MDLNSTLLKNESKNICIICLDDLNSKKQKALECNHYFHETCINNWFVVSNECPICRYQHNVNETTLHEITRINFRNEQCFVATISSINIFLWFVGTFADWKYILTVFAHMFGLFGTIYLKLCYLKIYSIIWVCHLLSLLYQIFVLFVIRNYNNFFFWIIFINAIVSFYMVYDLIKLITKITSYQETISFQINPI